MIRRSFFGKLSHAPRSSRDETAPVSDQDPPETVHHMVELEQRQKVQMSASDHLADSISAFAGQHAVRVAPCGVVWCLDRDQHAMAWLELRSVSLRPAYDDRLVGGNISLDLAEQEVTKVLGLLADIHRHLGISDEHDEEVQSMQEPTEILKLADAMDLAEQSADAP